VEFRPDPVAIDRQAKKNENGNGSPDHLEEVIAVRIVGRPAFPAAIAEQIDDQDALHRDKNKEGQPKDENQDAVDLLSPGGVVGGNPIQVSVALLGEGAGETENERQK
jgi:hypothetical protein